MSDEKLTGLIRDMLQQIADKTYSIDCALINLRQIKHAYSKDNFDFLNAICPAVVSHFEASLKDETSAARKLSILKEKLTANLELMLPFVNSAGEQLNLIHASALACSKSTTMSSIFHLFLQLLFKEEVLEGDQILKWASDA